MTTCLGIPYNQKQSQGPQEKLKTENKMSLPAEQFVKLQMVFQELLGKKLNQGK